MRFISLLNVIGFNIIVIYIIYRILVEIFSLILFA